jgi:hypothetical protein
MAKDHKWTVGCSTAFKSATLPLPAASGTEHDRIAPSTSDCCTGELSKSKCGDKNRTLYPTALMFA